MLCFQRNWFRADLCEMARSCSKLQQVDKLRKYVESSTIKVFYWGWLRVRSEFVFQLIDPFFHGVSVVFFGYFCGEFRRFLRPQH